MSRKNYIPGSERTDKALVPYEMVNFGGAVIQGIAPSKIPDIAIAEAYDVIIYNDEIVGREGTILYTNTTIPPIDGRTGYSATMTDGIVTILATTFTEDDVSNYFVFSGSPDRHYLIIEYIANNQVRVHTEDTIVWTDGCYIRGKTNFPAPFSIFSQTVPISFICR